jgi:hypothetical protein
MLPTRRSYTFAGRTDENMPPFAHRSSRLTLERVPPQHVGDVLRDADGVPAAAPGRSRLVRSRPASDHHVDDDDDRRRALLDLVFELVGRVEPTGGLATPASVARTTRAPSITADTSPIVPSTRNAACRSAPADV